MINLGKDGLKMKSILDETFESIKHKISLDKIKIESLYLSNYFNIIQLNNSSVGSCMNYFNFESKEDIIKTYKLLIKKHHSDPLLLRYLSNEKNQKDLLKLNLKACLVSALSSNLLTRPSGFSINKNLDYSIFSNITSAVIIGFGGYMDSIIGGTSIKKVHISDLGYDFQKSEMDGMISLYKKRFPDKIISISNGKDNKEKIQNTDLVSITGSAFCNGTMDELLYYSKNCKKIIIQGQSASIYPEILFKNGVSLISTTIKPTNLLQVALNNFVEFKYLLEGNLPWIHITPKKIETF